MLMCVANPFGPVLNNKLFISKFFFFIYYFLFEFFSNWVAFASLKNKYFLESVSMRMSIPNYLQYLHKVNICTILFIRLSYEHK